jgi:hypothetical protein
MRGPCRETLGGTLNPVTCVHDPAWIAELTGDAKGLPEQRVPVCRTADTVVTSSAKLSREEPDAGNWRVRICGGQGW